MRRETTNIICFAIEDCLPPIVRDSGMFRGASRLVWGEHIDHFAEFRRRAAELEEYERLPRVHEQTDNSRACIDQIIIIEDVLGGELL
jgi:hypothetical protein